MNRRPVLLAVAVVTATVLPAFLTGGLAVRVRGELGFGAAALGLAVAAFFAFSALASAVMERLVERIGAHRGMRLAALGRYPGRRGATAERPRSVSCGRPFTNLCDT